MHNASSERWLGTLVGLGLLCLLASPSYAQTQLARSTLSTAGGFATNGTIHLTAIIGQTVVGQAPGVQGGFLLRPPRPTGTSAEDGTALPEAFSMSEAWPNPFRDRVSITFALPKASDVRVTVFDVLGRPVAVLTDRLYTAGAHEITWEPEATPTVSGHYLVHLQTSSFTKTRSLVRIW